MALKLTSWSVFRPAQLTALEHQHRRQRIFEDVVVQCAQRLHHEKRREAPLAKQAELGAV